MSSDDYLTKYFSQLTDQELVVQLYEKRLTDDASQLARKELTDRGIDLDRALSIERATRDHANARIRELQQKRRGHLRRVLRFPVRALLGVESPWMLLVVGLVLAYPLFRGTVDGITTLVLLQPRPDFALPLSFAILAAHELALAWFSVSLWRCAPKSGVTFAVWFMRALSLHMAYASVVSTMNVVSFFQQLAQMTPGTLR